MLRDGNKSDLLFIEELKECHEITQRSGKPIDFVDDNAINFFVFNILKKSLNGRSFHSGACETAVVILEGKYNPAKMLLALDVAFGGFALIIERSKVLIQPFASRFAGVD